MKNIKNGWETTGNRPLLVYEILASEEIALMGTQDQRMRSWTETAKNIYLSKVH